MKRIILTTLKEIREAAVFWAVVTMIVLSLLAGVFL